MKYLFRSLIFYLIFLNCQTICCQTKKDTLAKIREFNDYALGHKVSEVLLKYGQDTTKFNFEADDYVVYIALDLGFFCCPRIACENKNCQYWKDIWNYPIIYQEIYNKKGRIKRTKRL